MKNRKIKSLIFLIFALTAIFIVYTRTREIFILNTLQNLNTSKNDLYDARLILHENELLIISINNMLPVITNADNVKEIQTYSSQNQEQVNRIEFNFQKLKSIKEQLIPLKGKDYIARVTESERIFIDEYKKKYSSVLEKKENLLKVDDIYPEDSPTKREIKSSLKESIVLLNTGLSESYDAMILEFRRTQKIMDENITASDTYLDKKYRQAQSVGILLLLTLILIFIIVARYLSRVILTPVTKIQDQLDRITLGELPEDLTISENMEHKKIAESLNQVVDGLRKGAEFSEQIGTGNFDMKFKLLSDKDVLGNSLLTLRDNLQNAKAEEEKRKKEDEQRNRTNVGLTSFAEILRQHPENLNLLADNIISSLVKFLNANQGALFFLNDSDKSNVYYELIGAYAYNRKKYLTKHIKPGEGLVGAVAIEKYTVYMTDVPDDYIEIESGTGSANPRSVLIIPLKMDENVLGIIEMASFNTFEKYEIEMAEKIAESISSSLANTSINMQTKALLEKSKDMEKAVLEQEKELIQTNKEIRDLKKKIEDLTSENEELKSVKA